MKYVYRVVDDDGETIEYFGHEHWTMAWLEAYVFATKYLDERLGKGKWLYVPNGGNPDIREGQFHDAPYDNGLSHNGELVPLRIEKVS